jgi:hypothetical protein
VNLALNKQTHQSGDETAGRVGDTTDGLSSGNAVDGNQTTRWSSDFNNNAWMVVDLGTPMPFDRVVINWQNAYGVAYDIQTSNTNNGTDWVTVYPQANGKGGIDDLTFPEVTARYVRFNGVTRSTVYGYSFYEFQIYDMPTPPTVTSTLANQTVTDGQSASFTVTATGTAPLTYNWYENGTLLSATSSASFITAPLSAANDNNAQFWVVAANSAGTAQSNKATVTVQSIAPKVTGTLASQTVTAGGTATFTIAATGSNPLTYAWFENGAQIGSTTQPTFTTQPLTANDNNAQIWVVVSNGSAQTAQSNSAILTVQGGSTGGTGGGTGTGSSSSGSPNLALAMVTHQSGDQNYRPGRRRHRRPVGGQCGRWQSRHPLVVRFRRHCLDDRRSRLGPDRQSDGSALGERLWRPVSHPIFHR